jgi:AcrR family transcriptional regulator
MTKPVRRYGGIPMAERQAERRDRLIRAAVAVSGRQGLEAASVAAICAEAGLTARYFYEAFANREALFLEAFGRVQQELFLRVEASIDRRRPVESALAGFFSVLAEHPGPARVFLLDVEERDAAMKASGREAGRRLGLLIAPRATSDLARAGATGAVVQIARLWIESGFAAPVADIVATALPFARAAAR